MPNIWFSRYPLISVHLAVTSRASEYSPPLVKMQMILASELRHTHYTAGKTNFYWSCFLNRTHKFRLVCLVSGQVWVIAAFLCSVLEPVLQHAVRKTRLVCVAMSTASLCNRFLLASCWLTFRWTMGKDGGSLLRQKIMCHGRADSNVQKGKISLAQF